MTKITNLASSKHQIIRVVVIIGLIWTAILAISLIFNITQVKNSMLEAGRIHARAEFERDIIYRRWNSLHGGVYVQVDENTQPNPYLKQVPERDITTPSGRRLTLVNPAYMTRQAFDLAKKEQGIISHITSLQPINPLNEADEWEKKALQAFEKGTKEVSSLEIIEGKEYMRLMKRLVIDESCLKCHAFYGSKIGDIRGGISEAIPMAPLNRIAGHRILHLSVIHIIFWTLGLIGLVITGKV